MEIYNNKDQSVTKYLHEDGSETCIKVVPSQKYIIKEDGSVQEHKKEKEKYSVLISHSSGCPIGCEMCYLTIKGYPYHPLKYYDITGNVIRAIQAKVKENPRLKTKYIKLCWMGMGDAFLDLQKVNICTKQILDYVFRNNLAVGLDGVDIGTVFPKGVKNLYILNDLNKDIQRWWTLPYGKNPHHKEGRSHLRVFYSLHSILNRGELVPKLPFYRETRQTLEELKRLCGIDVIFHQIFLEGFNDNNSDITSLIRLFERLKDFELRILRYNECKDSTYKESSKFKQIVQELNKSIPKIKYQISPGSEIRAACGQFLLGTKPLV